MVNMVKNTKNLILLEWDFKHDDALLHGGQTAAFLRNSWLKIPSSVFVFSPALMTHPSDYLVPTNQTTPWPEFPLCDITL